MFKPETGENPLDEIFDELLAEFLEAADLDTDIQRMDSTMVKANIKHLSKNDDIINDTKVYHHLVRVVE